MAKELNYPDILGVITNNNRLSVDVLQCALTTRPDKVNAGQNFEVLFLLQNAADIDVDVTISLKLPNRDHKGSGNMFYSKSENLLVGLEPGEVGYVTLPASCSPKTAPGNGYAVGASIKVARMAKDRKPRRIRSTEGGGALDFQSLTERQRRIMVQLRTLSWETDNKRNHIEGTFEVLPPSLSTLTEFSPGWVSIWTLSENLDDMTLIDSIQEHLTFYFAKLNKAVMFKPLLELNLERFNNTGYTIQTAEAIMLSKLMAIVLCDEYVETYKRQKLQNAAQKLDFNKMTQEMQIRLTPPKWVRRSSEILFKEPRFRDFPEVMLKEHIYYELLNDTIIYGFQMLDSIFEDEDFGTPEEIQDYANDLVQLIKKGEPINYEKLYLPLVLAAVTSNNKLSGKGENPRETLFALVKAHEKRASEVTPDNQFISTLFNEISTRFLDMIY